MRKYLQKYVVWLLLLLAVDLLAALMLWLADVQAFQVLMVTIVLASILLFALLFAGICSIEKRRRQAFLNFLGTPDEQNEAKLLRLISCADGELVQEIGQVLRKHQQSQRELLSQKKDYEEYVEGWAHEIKTPISLLTFLLDNHREELSSSVGYKLDYIRTHMQESVNQMLYYARVKAIQKDYLLEPLLLLECCEEVVENYRPLLDEKEFLIVKQIASVTVLSDRRGLNFLLSQIISNCIKYNKTNEIPQISIKTEQTKDSIVLHIKDNGIGVRSCDLPFLFEKGFTGDTGGVRNKATGLGLYLAKAIADDLKITLSAASTWQEGFEISLHFPRVE